MPKICLGRKGECTHTLKDMDGPKERPLLQEYDSHLKKKMVSRIITSRGAERGTGCLAPLDATRTRDTDSSGTGRCSLCRCTFCCCKSQVQKLLQQVITEKVKILTPRLSSSCIYLKKKLKQKTSRREASLILGRSPSAGKT